MPRPSTADTLAKVHADAKKDFDKIQSATYDVRQQCLEDRRFYSITGAQWEGPLGDQFENKPRFELNKTHLAVIRVVNEYRNNRVSVDFSPKDGAAEDKLSETCDGLYRADEQTCAADEAYDNAFEEATAGGIGAWRLRAVYEDEYDEDNSKQRVALEPIHDADQCVFFDLDAKRQDKSDAKRCYVLVPMSHDAYREEYDEDPADWPKSCNTENFDWITPEVVWVCEHYRVEESTEMVHYFRGLVDDEPDMRVRQAELEDDPDKLAMLTATGFRRVGSKRVKVCRVHKYILSGSRVLSDEGYIAGKCIPIVVTYGKRWVVNGIERCMGHVRLAKDAQRLTNALMSWLAEMAGRFDIEKPIVTPEQIAGHALMWAEDNVKKYPYLLLNPVTDENGQRMPAGPLSYTKAPNVPPAMAALMQLAEQSLQDLLGNQQAGEEMQPNMSGKAVELIQNRLDMQVFIYMSNFARAMKRSGEIWLSMMKDIAVENERKMKTLGRDGDTGSVVLNAPAYDAARGLQYTENDMARASLDVFADVGPSSSSRKAATVRALTGMMSITQDPETLQVLGAMAMLNMDGEGIGEVRDFFRQRLVRMGVVKPTKEEQQQMAEEQANQQPDPNAQYLLQAAEAEAAKAQKARADVVDTLAAAKLKTAQTAKVRAETGSIANSDAISTADAFMRAATPPKLP